MDKIKICKHNDVYLKIKAEPSIIKQLSEVFVFEVPNAKFHPKVKRGVWDGKIRLLNSVTCLLYSGLVDRLIDYCLEFNYEIELEESFSDTGFTGKDLEEFVNTLDSSLDIRDYQARGVTHAINKKRAIILSPTGSGKSFMIFLIARFYNLKTLIIVPTVSLVHQLADNFEEYGMNPKHIHKITAGEEKCSSKKITISTYQSIYTLDASWFKDYDVVIGDEVHSFKAKSLVGIMENLKTCQYRFGFTGTLDGCLANELVIVGLFGESFKVTSTKELIEHGTLANFKINAIVLKYSEEIKKAMKLADYTEELEFILGCKQRNAFIANLAVSLEGNSIVFFRNLDHGAELYKMIQRILKKTGSTNRNLYMINGSVDGEEREKIRKVLEDQKDAIVVASYGTSSTGINIRNLHNAVFASPSKSRVRNLQSIGRILRTHDSKDITVLYDIADDLSVKKHKNHTLNHFLERIKIYNQEKFDYKIFNEDLLFDV